MSGHLEERTLEKVVTEGATTQEQNGRSGSASAGTANSTETLEPRTQTVAVINRAAARTNGAGTANPSVEKASIRITLADDAMEEKEIVSVANEREMAMEPAERPLSPRPRSGRLPNWLAVLWGWANRRVVIRHPRKRLRVCETVSLGDKRFLAVVQVDGEQFLVGGASGSVANLARLDRPQEFSDVLKQRWKQDPGQA
jgi:hypothetical protein